MRIGKHDIGHRCTVEYDDVGRVDAMIVGEAPHCKGGWLVFLFEARCTNVVEARQIVAVDILISPPKYS